MLQLSPPAPLAGAVVPTGATGATGPQGPAGEAATITIGTVTTGEPGTNASVVNTGTEQDAVLNFTIPRGATGASGSGVSDVLLTTDTPPQATTAGGALSFALNSLLIGSAITHATPSSNVVLNQKGIYLVAFHGTVGLAATGTVPASSLTYMTQNGTNVPGSDVLTSLTSTSTYTAVSFTVPIQVTTTPVTLRVLSQQAGILYSNISLTVIRLGDNPEST